MEQRMPAPKPLVVRKVIKAPVSKVWKTLTRGEEMKHWFFKIWEFQPVVGFDFTFCLPDENKSIVTGVITEIEEGKKIAYSWNYDDFQVETRVLIEIAPEGENNSTTLTLRHEGLEKISEIKNFSKKDHRQGWEKITGVLKKYLEK